MAARAGEADVTGEGAVAGLADAAVERFGRIDVWVNNAGVIACGKFDRMPAAAFRRVVETNFFGHVHGARAALPHFRRQGAGVLINMCSVWGRVTSPYVSPYVASKFALRAFGECLHQELLDEPGIRVATLLPPSVDTPIFRHAGNWTGREILPGFFSRVAPAIFERSALGAGGRAASDGNLFEPMPELDRSRGGWT